MLQGGFPHLQTVFDVAFPLEVIGGGEAVESGMKPLVIVFVNIGPDDALGLLQSPQCVGSHTFGLEGLMEAFHLPVGLGMSHPDPGMNHLLVPLVGSELVGQVLGPVVGDDAGFGTVLGKGSKELS